jgi:type IV pilus assembly protein PilV
MPVNTDMTARNSLMQSKASAKLTRGFTLLEVLIVLIVLSFGLLGVASLQANTAKFKINSWARSAASVQFSALADAMRANPGEAGTMYLDGPNNSASSYGLTDDWATQQSDTLAIATDCLTSACSPAQRATFDMTVWRREVRSLLPQGAVTVTGNSSRGVTATIAWFDKQFVDTTGTPGRSLVCAAGQTNAAEQANCCPATLTGDPALENVRCTNVTFVP